MGGCNWGGVKETAGGFEVRGGKSSADQSASSPKRDVPVGKGPAPLRAANVASACCQRWTSCRGGKRSCQKCLGTRREAVRRFGDLKESSREGLGTKRKAVVRGASDTKACAGCKTKIQVLLVTSATQTTHNRLRHVVLSSESHLVIGQHDPEITKTRWQGRERV